MSPLTGRPGCWATRTSHAGRVLNIIYFVPLTLLSLLFSPGGVMLKCSFVPLSLRVSLLLSSGKEC